jgi:hypothetical protein
MSSFLKADQWVYVVIQDPGNHEQYLGQHDEEQDISFIPVFLKKDDALMCLNLLVRDKTKKYEIQAVMYGDLKAHAAAGGFMIYLLNNEGGIVEKFAMATSI